MLGFGVCGIPDGVCCEQAVSWALESGYRHLDTAQAYGNERSVGRALRNSGLPREEVFVTTKFASVGGDPLSELQRSLLVLGLEYVDLYLIQGPGGLAFPAWTLMQQAYRAGWARSIGVSGFASNDLAALLVSARVQPAVNQVGFNPHERDVNLLDTCVEADVVLEARSPFGAAGRDLAEPAVGDIAGRLGRTPAQVLLRWCIERAVPVVVKSTRRERIGSNAQIFDFELSRRDRRALDEIDSAHVAGALATKFAGPRTGR